MSQVPGPGSVPEPRPDPEPGPTPGPSPTPPGPEPAYGAVQDPGPVQELARDEEWQRLDPRMLVVHPLGAVLRFLPVLLGVFIAGSASGGRLWQFTSILVPIALGVFQYYTTTFRIHAGRIDLRRGLLSRQVRSTAIDRVRTVDLTAPLIHRVLGLTRMQIGTGTSGGEDQLDLDGLPTARAHELRAALLRAAPAVGAGAGSLPAPGTPAGAGGVGSAADAAGPAGPVATAAPVVSFTPAWLRFAPFTSSGLVIAGATIGLLSQVGDQAGLFRRIDPDSLVGQDPSPSVLLLVLGPVVLLVLVSFFAVLGYLVTNWDFRLTRAGGWHVRRGLLTTRETTLDEERVAGVVLGEQAGLRLARGRRLAAIVTGLDASQQTSSSLVPPAPTATVLRAAATVLGTEAPLTGPLTTHGPAAVRRRWARALVPALLVAVAAVVAVVLGAPAWLLAALLTLPVAALLALDRSRALGHALSEGFLVSRSGSLTRKRSVLEVEHVIGWNLRATWFQRRVGLATLVATTAGGSQSVTVTDVPEARAVAVAQQALPDLVGQFLDTRPGPRGTAS